MDPATTANIMCHVTIDRALRSSLQDARSFLTRTCAQQLQNSANIQEQGNFAFLALYVFGILKSAALRSGADIKFDQRVAQWTRFVVDLQEYCRSSSLSGSVYRWTCVLNLCDFM